MTTSTYQEQVYTLVKMIPRGEVASYGMIASLLPGVTARMVGYAMAASVNEPDLPWHRVINSQGKMSIPGGTERQVAKLLDDGVSLTKSNRVSFKIYRWNGPSQDWLEQNSVEIADFMTIKAGWP
ncbi:MGMT family protein [Temperatibacter marinus]|uniref:MGMT family protein n=1 Tax=Temperatibacter marinus TaxID=1456591 RepID=A0AA52H9L5_9PROT|nr:MGMT family protein [Temperatibacter marinus]WND03321.1 MGMT family protein [Temperatibacter marinus]